MGQVFSLEHQVAEAEFPSKAIMLMVYEKKTLTPLSFVEFVKAPGSYTINPLILYEPFEGVAPTTTHDVPEKVSYHTTVRTLHQNFKITPYQFKRYRLWIFASSTVSQATMNELLEFSRHFNFEEFHSTSGVFANELFYDLKNVTSFAGALRPPSAGIRCSSPVRPHAFPATGPLLLRRSQQATRLVTTFKQVGGETVSGASTANDCDLVVDGLYIGGETAARDGSLLASLGVTHIVNLNGRGVPDAFPDGFEYYTVKMSDSVFEDLNDDFWHAVDFVSDAIAGGGCVLVHCRRGISRSAALCVAYLMESRKLTFDAALAYLQKQRPAVNINQGFVEQLKAREAAQRAKSSPFRGKSLLRSLVLS